MRPLRALKNPLDQFADHAIAVEIVHRLVIARFV
jgi:hypothetical protein